MPGAALPLAQGGWVRENLARHGFEEILYGRAEHVIVCMVEVDVVIMV